MDAFAGGGVPNVDCVYWTGAGRVILRRIIIAAGGERVTVRTESYGAGHTDGVVDCAKKFSGGDVPEFN